MCCIHFAWEAYKSLWLCLDKLNPVFYLRLREKDERSQQTHALVDKAEKFLLIIKPAVHDYAQETSLQLRFVIRLFLNPFHLYKRTYKKKTFCTSSVSLLSCWIALKSLNLNYCGVFLPNRVHSVYIKKIHLPLRTETQNQRFTPSISHYQYNQRPPIAEREKCWLGVGNRRRGMWYHFWNAEPNSLSIAHPPGPGGCFYFGRSEGVIIYIPRRARGRHSNISEREPKSRLLLVERSSITH